jgi:type VI secretion system protein ImpA
MQKPVAMRGADTVLDIAVLATAIPGSAPAGADLRQDFSPQSAYYRLRDARAEARELERRLDQNQDPADDAKLPPLWRLVRELALKALAEQTKDLEIATWLTEALVRLDGLAGIRQGAQFVSALVDDFWDHSLYPVPDEEGTATRVLPIAGLNGTLPQPLRKLELFKDLDGTPVRFWHYAQSEDLERITDAASRKQRLGAGVKPLESLDRAAAAQGPAHFAQLRAEANAAFAAWTDMGERLDRRAGADGPPIGRVSDVLQAIMAIAKRYAPPEEPDEMEPQSLDPVAGVDEDQTPEPSAARPAAREPMLKELIRIAEYFRRTEPHSPLAYTLEEAVRRARLTWPELLEEVVPDGGVRNAILVMLGIRPSSPPK